MLARQSNRPTVHRTCNILAAALLLILPITASAQMVDEAALFNQLQETQKELAQRSGKKYTIDGEARVIRQREHLQMIKAFEETFPQSDKLDAVRTDKLATMHALVADNYLNPSELQEACEQILAGNPGEDLASNAAYRLIDMKVKQTPVDQRAAVATELYTNYVNKYPTSMFNSSAYQMLINMAEDRGDMDQLKKYAAYLRSAMPEDRATRKVNGILLNKEGIGKPLSIQYTSIKGEEIDTARMKGKVVAIFFWASWCGPCKSARPKFQEVYEKYHDQGLEMVSVSLDRTTQRRQLDRYIEESGFIWPISFNGKSWDNPLAVKFGVGSTPTIYLIDREGNLAYTDARTDFETKVKELIEKPAPSESKSS